MALTFYFHPLSSFCHKALIALYENETPVELHSVNLQDDGERAAFRKLWPVGKFPVLKDDTRNELVPESTAIIEYLQLHYPGAVKFIPSDAEQARRVRLLDRNIDMNLHIHMQKIIGDRIRPADKRDPHGVEDALWRIAAMCGVLEKEIAGKSWLAGEQFTLADCAAAPPLFYVDLAVKPLVEDYPNLTAYLGRLKQRASYARVLKEAEPFLQYVPR